MEVCAAGYECVSKKVTISNDNLDELAPAKVVNFVLSSSEEMENVPESVESESEEEDASNEVKTNMRPASSNDINENVDQHANVSTHSLHHVICTINPCAARTIYINVFMEGPSLTKCL